MKRRIQKIAITALAVLLALGAAAGCRPATPPAETPAETTEPKKGGTLVVALPGYPTTFNPNARPDDMGVMICQNIFNKLVTLDNEYNLLPDLASDWTVSDDGKTITFDLVSTNWHDGEPFTSDDVKWTLQAIIDNSAVAAEYLALVETIETPAANQVVLNLKAPAPSFLTFLGWFGTYIMPKHLYDTGEDWLTNPANESPVGTGPFMVDSFKSDEHITLVANPDYFGGAPYLDKIIYRVLPDPNTAVQAFLNEEVDVSLTRPPLAQVSTLQSAKGVKLDIYPLPSRYYLPMNLSRDTFQKIEVRQAIGMAINREEILTKALMGIGQTAEGYYTPAIPWAYNKAGQSPQYDPAAAEELLDAAGFPRGSDGVRLRLSLVYFQGTEWSDIATVIAENLGEIGIESQLVQLEMGAWSERVLGQADFDLTLLAGQQGPDPDAMRMRFGTGGALNMMGYSNPELDEALMAAATTLDRDVRQKYYWQAQEILAQDQPFVPLVEMVDMVLYRDIVSGMFHQDDSLGKVPQLSFSKTWLNN